jgi:hypothetical protein
VQSSKNARDPVKKVSFAKETRGALWKVPLILDINGNKWERLE